MFCEKSNLYNEEQQQKKDEKKTKLYLKSFGVNFNQYVINSNWL